MAIASIRASSPGIEFEIVVVSPHLFSGDKIVHVDEADRKGSAHAQAAGYAACRGDIIVTFSDDHLATLGWLDTIESKVAAMEHQFFPLAVGFSRAGYPWFGTTFGLFYPYFPIMSRRSVVAVDGWISPEYRAHFADADLAMRVWQHGGRCELCFDSFALVNPCHRQFADSPLKGASSFQRDADLFVEKYYARFGNGFMRRIEDITGDYFLNYIQDNTFMLRIPKRLVADNDWEKTYAGDLASSMMYGTPTPIPVLPDPSAG